MKYSLYFLTALLLLSACGNRYDENDTADTADKQKIRITVYHYGIWGGSSTNSEDNVPTDLKQETDTITMLADRTIGIQYEIASSPNADKAISLREVWVKPHKWYDETYDDSTNRIEQTVYPSYSQYSFMQYKITDADLKQKGRWQLLVYYNKRLMYRKNFFLT